VTRHYVPGIRASASPTAIQLSHVEVDVETGFVRLLKHWCVEDCGRIINPRLVDEQIRGAIVQGIAPRSNEQPGLRRAGAALTGTMMDYSRAEAAEDAGDRGVARRGRRRPMPRAVSRSAGEAGTAARRRVLNASTMRSPPWVGA